MVAKEYTPFLFFFLFFSAARPHGDDRDYIAGLQNS